MTGDLSRIRYFVDWESVLDAARLTRTSVHRDMVGRIGDRGPLDFAMAVRIIVNEWGTISRQTDVA